MAGQKNYFGKGDIRPSLPGIKKPENPADPTISAKNSLKSAEDSATSKVSTISPLSSENEAPESPSFYVSSGRRNNNKNNKKSSSFGSRLLKISPALAVVAIILLTIITIFGSNSLLGPHLEALFTEATNTDYTAYTLRSNELTKEILAGDLEMPDYYKERLEKEGITVRDDQTLEYNGATITAENFETTYNSNVEFREALTYARRGRVATFFDEAAEKFRQKLGLSMDVFHNYETTGDQTADDKSYTDFMTNYFSGDAGITIGTAAEETSEEDDSTTVVSNGAISTSSISGESAKERAKEYLDSVGNKVEAKTPGCAALEIGSMIATAIASNERYAAAHDFMTKTENISKSKYGNGDTSAINSVLNWFTKTETSTVYNATTGEEIEVTGSPLEAEGMRVVLGGLSADRANTKKYSLERSFESTDASITTSGLATTACNVERSASSLISLSALGIPGSGLIRATIGLLLDTTIGTGVQIVASSILSFLVPTIAEVMFENPFENAVGIAGGEYYAKGAASVNMLASQQNSGGTGGSRSAVLAYNQANEVVIAQQAEIDRKNYNPFDASNKNTFLGTIASSLLPLATTSSTISSPLSTLTSTTATSLASLSSTYAAGENTSLLTNFGDYCGKLEAVGGSGNIYCIMTSVHDLSTMDVSENNPTYQAVLSESLEIVDGKETIKKNSPLAHFITFWMGRYSMPGVYDANIANACSNSLDSLPFLSSITSITGSLSSDEYCSSVADGSRYMNNENNPAWDSVEKWHQLYILSNRIKNNLGFYEDGDNPVAAYQNQYDQENPLDNSRSGYLARISGLTKYDAETVLAISDYYQKVAAYSPLAAYFFGQNSSEKALEDGSQTTEPEVVGIKTTTINTAIRREDYIS